MSRWGLLILAACYRPAPSTSCTIACTADCPDGLSCVGGLCVADGTTCGSASFTTISAGTDFACAIDTHAQLWCWGSNAHLQISSDRQLALVARPTLRDSTHSWTAIDAGTGHACGIADGALMCWGQNDRQEVTSLQTGDVGDPQQIALPTGASTWSAVSAGFEDTCAIADGTVYCWGQNTAGQLGDGGINDHGLPAPIAIAVHDFTLVSTNGDHSCAVSMTAGVQCWGKNNAQQLGVSNVVKPSSLVPVQSSSIIATSIAVANATTCMTTADHQLLCWGDNLFMELGDPMLPQNQMPNRATPMPASTLPSWNAVSAGENMLCGLTGDQLFCWGSATNGGLGAGLWNQQGFHFVEAGVKQVSVGYGVDLDGGKGDRADLDLACTLTGAGTQCWGDDRFGQLGTGAAAMAIAPTEVIGGHLFSSLALGGQHSCGLEAGDLYCWGSTLDGATNGQILGGPLPDLTASPCMPGLCDVATPQVIGFASGSTQVAVGTDHTCAFRDPDIQCWGQDQVSQLGVSMSGPGPVQVPAALSTQWSGLLATGASGQCALSVPNNHTFCWGIVLGDTTAAPKLALDGVIAIALDNGGNGCFLDNTSQLECAGDNSSGEYGNGTNGGSGTCNLTCDNGESCATLCSTDCNCVTGDPIAHLQRSYQTVVSSPSAPSWCGLRLNGTVECWGDNKRGQTGAVPGSFEAVPVPVVSLCSAVAMGDLHACAICNGHIVCWGDNTLAQLGTGPPSPDPMSFPQTIPLVLAGDPWMQLVAAGAMTCAISAGKHAYCWGTAFHGALGNGGVSANLPTMIP